MKTRRTVLYLVLLAIAWVLRAFWHPLIMEFLIHPIYAVLFVMEIWIIILLVRLFRGSRVVKDGKNVTLKLAHPVKKRRVIGVVLIAVILMICGGVEQAWRYKLASTELSFDSRASLPDFSPIRLVPKPVATRFADDSFQSPQEYLGDSQIAIIDGSLQRVYPRLPDGWLLYLTQKLSGFVTVNVDSLDRQVKIYDQPFNTAEHVGVFDNINFRLVSHKYFVTYSSEPIYLKDDQGQWITVVPYMSYKGVFVRTPYWAGLSVVRSDGSITDYTPEEAQAVSYLKDNRLYPKELATFAADAYSYKDGILNNWFLHKNQAEVVRLPSDETIIHAATNEGLKEVIVAEPYGRSYGVYRIFLIDAATGERQIISYDLSSQLTGPIAAADYIRREFPTNNWNTFSLSEPRPLTIGGQLHWLLSVVPNDNAGIATTVLLNAQTNKVIKIDSVTQLNQLIAGTIDVSTVPANDDADLRSAVDKLQEQLDALKKLLP